MFATNLVSLCTTFPFFIYSLTKKCVYKEVVNRFKQTESVQVKCFTFASFWANFHEMKRSCMLLIILEGNCTVREDSDVRNVVLERDSSSAQIKWAPSRFIAFYIFLHFTWNATASFSLKGKWKLHAHRPQSITAISSVTAATVLRQRRKKSSYIISLPSSRKTKLFNPPSKVSVQSDLTFNKSTSFPKSVSMDLTRVLGINSDCIFQQYYPSSFEM